MADDVELGNPSKKARLEGDFGGSVNADQAELDPKHYSSFSLSETDLNNQRNVGEGGQTDDEHPETSKSSADPALDSDTDSSVSALSNMSGLSGEESWKPSSGPMSWVYRQMSLGMDPRSLLRQLIPHETHIPDLDDLTLWKLVINIVCEPPPRTKLDHVNTLTDVLQLMKTCNKIMVLTGAGVSVSCGIPDFRSRNGVYARLAVDYPDLPDPQAMFDIHYFRNDQRPFFKFAKEIFPGQFEPSKCHKFIRLIEDHGKLLRNYTQNIDTLEQVAGISRIIQCHGSFASATCMVCGNKCTADDIKTNIMEQTLPFCPKCPPETPLAVMKPDIVFFGESLPEEFHNQMAADKEECDLLIVIGSSLKVRPVALIPNALPANIPQILINKEPLKALNFDVELLGDCDTIISELCRQLGEGWDILAKNTESLAEVTEDQLITPPVTPGESEAASQNDFLFENSQVKYGEDSAFETKVDSSGNIEQVPVADENKTKVVKDQSESGDQICSCHETQDENHEKFENSTKISGIQGGGKMVSGITESCDSSNLSHSTSEHQTGKTDEAQTDTIKSDSSVTVEEKADSGVSESKDNSDEQLAEVSTTKLEKPDNASKAQSCEFSKTGEVTGQSMDTDDEGSKKEESRRRCSSVCYGDKDTCGCSADINELRKMWKPAVIRCSVSKRLGPNQYCFMPPSRYVFPEAEVYTVIEDPDSNSSESDSDGLDDLLDTDENSDPLNTSNEQFDKNNSSSELESSILAAKPDNENLKVAINTFELGNITEKENSGLQKENKGNEGNVIPEISEKNENITGDKDVQYPLVTTSNELSDSLIENMDNFAKLDKDEMDIGKTEIESQDFKIDFEGT